MYGGAVMPGRRAGSGDSKYIQCREPKTGLQKVPLNYEDDRLCSSGYIIYLWGSLLAHTLRANLTTGW